MNEVFANDIVTTNVSTPSSQFLNRYGFIDLTESDNFEEAFPSENSAMSSENSAMDITSDTSLETNVMVNMPVRDVANRTCSECLDDSITILYEHVNPLSEVQVVNEITNDVGHELEDGNSVARESVSSCENIADVVPISNDTSVHNAGIWQPSDILVVNRINHGNNVVGAQTSQPDIIAVNRINRVNSVPSQHRSQPDILVVDTINSRHNNRLQCDLHAGNAVSSITDSMDDILACQTSTLGLFDSNRINQESTSVTESSSKMKGTFQCGICFDSFGEIAASKRQLVSTVCGHIFCDVCIKASREVSSLCPKCRKRLGRTQFHPLYL